VFRLQPPIEPQPWTWWYATCEEGPWHPGGATRDRAISEALGQGYFEEIAPKESGGLWHAGFFLCQCRRSSLNLAAYFDADEWLTRLSEDLTDEDSTDEDGGNGPLERLTEEDIRDLQRSIETAIWHWQNRRQKPLFRYYLDMKGTPEWITVPLSDVV